MQTENISAITNNAQSYITSLSIDTIIVIALFLLVFFYGVRAGKFNLISIILSSYLALVFFTYFPYFDLIKWDFGTYLQKFDITKTIILVALIVVVHKFLAPITESDFSENDKKWPDIIILSASFVLVFLSTLYAVDIATQTDTSAFLDNIFTNYVFWTLALPVIGIFITTRH